MRAPLGGHHIPSAERAIYLYVLAALAIVIALPAPGLRAQVSAGDVTSEFAGAALEDAAHSFTNMWWYRPHGISREQLGQRRH